MGFILLILFIGVPVIEITVFIQVGDVIGLWPTLIIVILTAIIGTALLRQQGLSTLMRAQASVNEGRLPAEEIFDGVCLLLAGAFLLTPGFVTDSVGFLLFFPPFRKLIRAKATEFILKNGNIHIVHPQGPRPQDPASPHDPTIIDADFEEVSPNPDSPWTEKKD
ncbi:MAG: FxsA family protein [Methylocystaceae bacterium]|nr:FxsA family protein [Methylocystaceae bacterium]